jgi:hemerythrin-like domain-containing protein
MEPNALSRDHAELEDRMNRLIRCADGGDCHDLAAEWNAFEADLERHLALEERELFPTFERKRPDEVAALREEHEALRRDLLALGIRSDLHHLRATAVADFIKSLRAHAQREEQALYPWADDELPRHTWAKIAASLGLPAWTGADAAAPE